MSSSMGFTFELDDGSNKLDARAWRAVVMHALMRANEGLVVCEADLTVLYCSPHAARWLGRLGIAPHPARALPEEVAKVVSEQLAIDDSARTDRLRPSSGGNSI